MRNVYVFSGLGADERIFCKINFDGFHPVFVKWMEISEGETLKEYAIRISEIIKEDAPLLIGLSYGGMIATEVAKQLEAEKLILISSAAERREIPIVLRIFGVLGVTKILPFRLMLKPNRFVYWFFGIKGLEQRKLLDAILADTHRIFFKRALGQIANWGNKKPFNKTVRIHGENDRVLPVNNLKMTSLIVPGGHFICYAESERVNEFIRSELNDFL